MNGLHPDLRFSLRRLRKSPRYAVIAMVMLGLGIGASVAMFSVLKSVALSELPYPGGDRVVSVAAFDTQNTGAERSLTPAEASHLADSEAAWFEAFGFYRWDGMTVVDDGRGRELRIAVVSQGFFPTLGMSPMLGRVDRADDWDDGANALVLSYTEWQRLTGGDPVAVGKTVQTVEHGLLRIAAVMPPTFAYPSPLIGAWRPLPRSAIASGTPGYLDARNLDAVGRLGRGLPADVALEHVRGAIAAMRESHGIVDGNWRIGATPLLEKTVGDSGRILWASLAVTLLVLLIACANVAILLDARQIAHRHEQAVAQALGASRTRLFRLMLIELGLLGAGGVALGILLAALALKSLRELAVGNLPRADSIELDGNVFLFSLLIGLATPLLVVLLGSLRLRSQPIDALRGSGKGSAAMQASRTRLMPVLGVSLSTAALLLAAAMIASLLRLQAVDPGFRTENVHVLQLGRTGDRHEWTRFSDAIQERLGAIPGVTGVALSSHVPMSGLGTYWMDVAMPGLSSPEPLPARLARVSPSYLDLLSIPLLAGRGFDASDHAGSERVAIINRTLARQAFGNEPAVGKTLAMTLDENGIQTYRIVGISEDTRNAGLHNPASAEVYVPFAQAPWIAMSFLVRTAGSLPGIAAQMREAVWSVDANEGISREFGFAEQLLSQSRPARFFARTIGGFALCTLLLASFGVYAVAAQHQQQRRAESGLRLAIGAPPTRLACQSLARSLLSGGLGIMLGIGAGWAMIRALHAQLFGFGEGDDILWLVGTVGCVGLTVVLAALPAALRTARTSPMMALRHE